MFADLATESESQLTTGGVRKRQNATSGALLAALPLVHVDQATELSDLYAP